LRDRYVGIYGHCVENGGNFLPLNRSGKEGDIAVARFVSFLAKTVALSMGIVEAYFELSMSCRDVKLKSLMSSGAVCVDAATLIATSASTPALEEVHV
jgi:hypothetical protein